MTRTLSEISLTEKGKAVVKKSVKFKPFKGSLMDKGKAVERRVENSNRLREGEVAWENGTYKMEKENLE